MKVRWKILIAIGLGMLASYILNATTKPTSEMLLSEYEFYNRKYFNSMPAIVDIQYGDLTVRSEMGATRKRDDGSYLIIIDKSTNPILKTADFTLLHEMCHIKLNGTSEIAIGSKELDIHGPAFQTCMLDLATRGAFKDIW
jgi:hypothetical protein